MLTRPVVRVNGSVSFWLHSLGQSTASRPPLPGDLTADVAIAGAGYTGLWTAYYLKRARPDLEIVVLERDFAGFGASGRNGGWLSDHFSTPPPPWRRPTVARGFSSSGERCRTASTR